MFSVWAHSSCPRGRGVSSIKSECVRHVWMRGEGCVCVWWGWFLHLGGREQIYNTAADTSEGAVRSNMEIHRCHRLHTEKEERVMLSLDSAYLAWDSSACQRWTLRCSRLASPNNKLYYPIKMVTWICVCACVCAYVVFSKVYEHYFPKVYEQMLHFSQMCIIKCVWFIIPNVAPTPPSLLSTRCGKWVQLVKTKVQNILHECSPW